GRSVSGHPATARLCAALRGVGARLRPVHGVAVSGRVGAVAEFRLAAARGRPGRRRTRVRHRRPGRERGQRPHLVGAGRLAPDAGGRAAAPRPGVPDPSRHPRHARADRKRRCDRGHFSGTVHRRTRNRAGTPAGRQTGWSPGDRPRRGAGGGRIQPEVAPLGAAAFLRPQARNAAGDPIRRVRRRHGGDPNHARPRHALHRSSDLGSDQPGPGPDSEGTLLGI
ncbi:MAG: hypothetical protein AVDCRST_MAG73-563, partial [uncultured Thermomicrobiales bacterium]